MISSYRLGDLVFLDLTKEELLLLLKEHPDSIGAEFIKRRKKTIDSITDIVMERIPLVRHLLPHDIEERTVVHVRLGDVVAGTKDHELEKRPYDIDYLRPLVHKPYVIGKCFFALPSSTNYEECIETSQRYLQDILRELDGTHFDSGNADIDLCCAVNHRLPIERKAEA